MQAHDGGEPLPDLARVVVTGVGMVSPYGAGTRPFLEGVRAGRPALRAIDDFDVSACRCTTGGRVPRLDLKEFDAAGAFRRMPRATQYAILATADVKAAAYGVHDGSVLYCSPPLNHATAWSSVVHVALLVAGGAVALSRRREAAWTVAPTFRGVEAAVS